MRGRNSWRWIALGAVALGCCVSYGAEVPVAELVKQMPAQDAAAAAELSAKLVAAGPAGVKEIAAMLVEPSKTDDSKARFALHGMAVYVARPGAEAERKMLVETLAGVLDGDIHWLVKSFLIQQLQLAGGKESIDVLAKFLLDENLCEFATQALLAIRLPECADAIRTALPNAKGGTRLTLVQALGILRDVKAVPAVLKASADQDREVRLAALFALGNIGDPAVADTLIKASSPEALYERAKATDALLLLGQRLVEGDKKADAEKVFRHLLTSRTAAEDSHVRCGALRGLVAAAGEKATDDLMGALKAEDADVRAVAADVTAALPGDAVAKRLIESLQGATPAARADTLGLLARRGDKAALPVALEAAKDADKAVRKAAIKAVAAIGKDEMIPNLIEFLSSKDGDDRRAAADSLILLPGDKATATLVDALKTSTVEARRELLGILAARGAKAHLAAIFACAKDENEGVRVAALDATGALGDDKALPAVLELLLTPKGGDRAAAERAADSIGRRATDKDKCADALIPVLLKGDVQAKCGLLRVLGGLGSNRGLDVLRAAIKDENAEIQEAGFRALARWPTVAVADELLSLAQNAKDPKHRVLALQGYIRVVALPNKRTPDETLKMYQAALAAATRPEEKKAILGPVSEIREVGAFRLVAPCLEDRAVRPEAEAAVSRIADRLRDTKDEPARKEIREALMNIVQNSQDDGRRKEATRCLKYYPEKKEK